jgi:NAD(P)-dependent dehydrogenase (short-subunit alcohol dehydrogenase family)
MRDLRSKHALVTGAASGIGRAIALELARHGMHLILWDIDPAGLAEAARLCRQMPGAQDIQVVVSVCDLSRPEQIDEAVARLLDGGGQVDLLVNNAGIAYHGPTERMPGELCDRMLAVNLLAPIRLTRLLLPSMLKLREAHVLNIASAGGLFPHHRVSAYQASKYGLVGFSRSLRVEYARHDIGVTVVCPGFVDTTLLASAAQHSPGKTLPHIPRRFITTPDVVARRAIRGVRRNRAVVLTDWTMWGVWWAWRLVPWLMDFLLKEGWRRSRAAKQKRRELDAARSVV